MFISCRTSPSAITAEQGIGRATPSAQRRLVDDVVVKQRRRVDELHRRGELEALAAAEAQRLGKKQDQHGADPLAAGADDVVRNLVDQGDVRCQPTLYHGVHLPHVFCHQGDRCREWLRVRLGRRGKLDGHGRGG
jgi:hypothetical protein